MQCDLLFSIIIIIIFILLPFDLFFVKYLHHKERIRNGTKGKWEKVKFNGQSLKKIGGKKLLLEQRGLIFSNICTYVIKASACSFGVSVGLVSTVRKPLLKPYL